MDGDDGLDFDFDGDTAGDGCMVASLPGLAVLLIALLFHLAFGEG